MSEVNIQDFLKIHKKTMFSTGKTAVECILKPYPSHAGYSVPGLTNFVGLTIDESGFGCFADSFEITFNIDDVLLFTNQIPARGWVLSIKLPQLNNKEFSFCLEENAIDRTLGLYLIKCSSSATQGTGKRIDRSNGGL